MKTIRESAGFLAALFFLVTMQSYAQWAQLNGPFEGYITSFGFNGTNIFAGTNGAGVFLSTNNGTSWEAVNSGLPSPFDYIFRNHNDGANIFAATFFGVYRSTNNGTNWALFGTGSPGANTIVAQGAEYFCRNAKRYVSFDQ